MIGKGGHRDVHDDRTARIWEAATGRRIVAFPAHRARVNVARFGPGGRSILTASDDGTARLHPCWSCGTLDDLVARARDRVTRDLSRGERRTFLHE